MLRKLRTLFFCVMLSVNLLSGVQMRPDEIETLMAAMRQPKVAHTLPDESYDGDGE